MICAQELIENHRIGIYNIYIYVCTESNILTYITKNEKDKFIYFFFFLRVNPKIKISSYEYGSCLRKNSIPEGSIYVCGLIRHIPLKVLYMSIGRYI